MSFLDSVCRLQYITKPYPNFVRVGLCSVDNCVFRLADQKGAKIFSGGSTSSRSVWGFSLVDCCMYLMFLVPWRLGWMAAEMFKECRQLVCPKFNCCVVIRFWWSIPGRAPCSPESCDAIPAEPIWWSSVPYPVTLLNVGIGRHQHPHLMRPLVQQRVC